MDKTLAALEQTWERYVGSLTPEEFLSEHPPNSTIQSIVEEYVGSMYNSFDDIEMFTEDIEEYLYRHIETMRDAVLGQLERLGFQDIPVFINNTCLQIAGKGYYPSKLLDVLESLQTCKPSDLVRAMWDAQC